MHHFGHYRSARCGRKTIPPNARRIQQFFCTAAHGENPIPAVSVGAPAGAKAAVPVMTRVGRPNARFAASPAPTGGAAVSVGAPAGAKAAVPVMTRVGWRTLAVRATPSLNKFPPPRTGAGAPSSRSGRSCRRCSRRWRAACPRTPSPGTAAAGCGGLR